MGLEIKDRETAILPQRTYDEKKRKKEESEKQKKAEKKKEKKKAKNIFKCSPYFVSCWQSSHTTDELMQYKHPCANVHHVTQVYTYKTEYMHKWYECLMHFNYHYCDLCAVWCFNRGVLINLRLFNTINNKHLPNP